MKTNCTMLKLFRLQEWFNKRFLELCHAHDVAYQNQTGWIKADWSFAKGVWKKGYKVLAIISLLFLLSFGWLYYFNIIKQRGWDKLT